MPITARLSRKFYDKLGDDVANELVEWFNAVDTSYRQEFRDLFEANFGRMEARLGAFEARLEARFAQQSAGFDVKLNHVETRFAQQTAEFDVKLHQTETRLVRWMFGFWVGSLAATLGLIIAVRQLWG
jgi:hypothetical protein